MKAVTPSTDAELEALLPSGTKLVKSKAGPGIALHEVEEGIHVQEKPPQFLNCYTPACRAAYVRAGCDRTFIKINLGLKSSC